MEKPNQMQWNLGGWIGGQLGGTVWMLVAGLLSFSVDPAAAVKVIALFALANLVGVLLWRRRGGLSPYTGIQILLPVLGVFGLTAVFVLDRADIYETIQIGAAISARATYIVIVVTVAALMLMFYFQFGRRSEKKDEAT
ncbi:hypothetical protein MnTg04_00015 [bacterium MnTg04]|nr:hypothetical protein MnTg02_01911 [bacterium MnTg02]GBF30079.1 hypothetical protein MnTg04_00015 [bacterium MnTg04]